MDFTRGSLLGMPHSPSQISLIDMNHWKQYKRLSRPTSVYGGAGGRGTRISNFSHMVNDNLDRGYLVFGNEKIIMRNLNERLAVYLEKVRPLSESNAELDMKIKKLYETNTPSARDYSAYYKQIQELRTQIKDALLVNERIVLKIDNTKRAAEELKMKYDHKKLMRLIIENDNRALKKVRDNITLEKSELETQVETLNKELILLKKDHQKEVDSLHKQLGNTIKVELRAAPSQNLSAIMEEMRKKYEALAKENYEKVKEQFKIQTETLQQQTTVNSEELKESEGLKKQLRQKCQTLRIDHNAHLSMKVTLGQTLHDTKAHYKGLLANIQEVLDSLEDQIMQIRTKAEWQNKEYNQLLDEKTQLEQEIFTYRVLLEREDGSTKGYELCTLKEQKIDIMKTRITKTVIQEEVDGKIVSSEVRKVEEGML